MWLCVDRIEGNTVVLLDDGERIYHLTAVAHRTLTGRDPAESDILNAEVEGDNILAAAYDETETVARKQAACARLNRLFGRT